MMKPVTSDLIHPDSLGETLDAVNAVLFYGQELPPETREKTALWVADRQGLPGSYAGMFAPTGYDNAFGAYTFTGEAIRSGAATGHILSEEACRALYLLGVQHEEVTTALERARVGIFKRLAESEPQGTQAGVYCCGNCSVALWRHLMVSRRAEDLPRLEHGIRELRRHRDEQGCWKRFPFYYTLLALSEMEAPGVVEEIQYAAPVVERLYQRLTRGKSAANNEQENRRKLVMERIFARC